MKVYPFTEPVTIVFKCKWWKCSEECVHVCVCVCRGGNCSWLKEKDTLYLLLFHCFAIWKSILQSHAVTIVFECNLISSQVYEAWKSSSSSWNNWDQSPWQCWKGPRWWPVWETGRVQSMTTCCADTGYYSWCVATITFVYGYFSKQSSSMSSCMRIAMNWELVLSSWYLQ